MGLKFKKIEPSVPRRAWKRWVALALLLVIGPTQFLNHTGFCYAEMRYLSERELVDRFLFGDQDDKMMEEEKIKKIKEWGGEYPNCCRIRGQFFNGFTGFSNNIIGNYIYQVETHFPEIPPMEEKYPFYENVTTMNSCGKALGYDSYGSRDDEKN